MPSFSRSDDSAGVTVAVAMMIGGAGCGSALASTVLNCVGSAVAPGIVANVIPLTLVIVTALGEINPRPGNEPVALMSVASTGPEYGENPTPEKRSLLPVITLPRRTNVGVGAVALIGP